MNFTSTHYEPMAMESIKRVAPSVFAERPWEGVSDRYAFIPTVNVVQSLISEGWNVTKAQQQRVMLPEKKEFTRHVLRFRRASEDLQVGDIFPEIVLINSHDRGSAYQMHAGLFRLVCSNGLIVDDSTFARLSIRHSGKVLDDVRIGADNITKEIPRITREVETMRTIELTPNEEKVFAIAAGQARYGEQIPFQPQALLRYRRHGDDKKDLWTTFNKIQENMLHGGIHYTVEAHRDEEGNYIPRRRMRTREVKGIDTDTKLNKALWTLAEAMKDIKLNN